VRKRDLRIIRQPTFRNIFLARAVSLLGTSMAPVALAFAAQAAVAVLFISGNPPIVLLVALSAVNGAANAMFIPAARGLVPQIAEPSELQSANALIRLSQNSASLAGGAISGAVIVAVGAGWAIGITPPRSGSRRSSC
jgi:predicted outer membrane repeat protein